MIISLFGPDGVGKSTTAVALKEHGFTVFSGTGVASWPDQSWHEEFVARGIDETKVNDAAHFLEKISRVYKMAYPLSRTANVAIDSDPFHKTLMHDFIKMNTSDDREARMSRRFRELTRLARPAKEHVHIQFKISDKLSDDEQATILYERLRSRGNLAYFDPKTKEESMQMIEASDCIANILRSKGSKVVTVSTLEPIDISSLLKLL